ncbi:MFS transporter [Cryobacterium sp. TMT1-21]|uniref:MFS transporter n=1 Tax=Cryobacterium shii TaxID=1259235 RepID=A0AAQ2C7U1_9MICO|nr:MULTISPECIES: MFS transporter [Cryobacterium]TFC49846.1 MFS transporter [Cryobacterium shii]TFC86040.1 MFS transporter [Cryobacterium sp. TmT2-59]TFD13787.1 MFS transporter [Cryobacterium sp. TMT4-10]TFD16750.1 MFS transporter [Cryobacterium sp. TMT1-21]TFD19821.1 MFS transporter [Cryobacterium sp. TMT2-23]
MMTTGLVAIDATILATAVPTIVKDLGGFAQFPWLFSIYLLAQAVSVPVYAKLADTVGRKPIVLIGIALFLLGSVLCGLAWSMPALIVFRAIQGLGAGAVQPMAVTIAGDIYTVVERAKVQGYLASVWAISSVVGPTLGGVFSQFLSWRWIFFVNIPLCVIAAWMLLRQFHETVEPRRHQVDYLGAGLLTVSLSLLIIAVLEGGQAWAWNSPQSIGSFGLGALLLALFVLAERGAAEPVLPLWVFSRHLLLSTALVSIGVGAILIGLTSFVPTYLEGALGTAPLTAGLALAALTIGWPISASLSGRLYLRIGFRNTALIGIGIVLLGVVALALFAATPSVAIVAASCFVTGLGLGLVATPSLIAAQSSVDWNERGVVTGANLFSRSIGSAVGVAIFGAVANAIFSASGRGAPDAATVVAASGAVFAAVTVTAALTMIAAISMPRTPAHRVQ